MEKAGYHVGELVSWIWPNLMAMDRTMLLLVAGLATLALYAFCRLVRRWAGGTIYRRVELDALGKYFEAFLREAGYLSVMTIIHRKSGDYVQFIRVMSENQEGVPEMLFAFARAQQTERFSSPMVRILTSNNITFSFHDTDPNVFSFHDTDPNVTSEWEVLFVRLDQDIRGASVLARLVLLQVYGLVNRDRYDISFYNTVRAKSECVVSESGRISAGTQTQGALSIRTTTLDRAAYCLGSLIGAFVRGLLGH